MADVYTSEALAERWRCSVRTVNRMAQTRELPALKRGRHWRFSESAVLAYEAAHTTVTDVQPVTSAATSPAPLTLVAPADMDGALPYGWWEKTTSPAPSAGRRGGSATTKKRRLSDAI